MSVKITGQRSFTTSNNSFVLSGKTKASLSCLFYFEPSGNPVSANTVFTVARNGYTSFWLALIGAGTTSNTVKAQFAWRLSDLSQISTNVDLPVGVIHHLAATFDQGSQKAYVNGNSYSIGSVTGYTQNASTGFGIGSWDFSPGSGSTWQISDINVWHDYALNAQDVLNLRNGMSPSQISGYSWRGEWLLDGTPGNTVTIGDSALSNIYDATYNFSVAAGGGNAVYTDQLIWSPQVIVGPSSYVTTGGKSVVLGLVTKNANNPVVVLSEIQSPYLYINGSGAGYLSNLWFTNNTYICMYSFPSGVNATANDTISITAPTGWMNTSAGYTDLTNNTLTNNTGKSCFGTESIQKTLPIGINVIAPMIYSEPSIMFKNLVLRIGQFSNTTVDASGYVLSTSNVNCAGTIYSFAPNNGIDSLGLPGISGLFAVGYDELDTTNPTNFFLSTGDFSSYPVSINSVGYLYNSGVQFAPTKISGIVKVYNVRLVATGTTVNTNVTLYLQNPTFSPKFSNLVVYGPGDFTFTSGVPIVLDKSDPWALSNTFIDRVSGAGTVRLVDSLQGNNIDGMCVEPEDFRNLNDFSYGIGLVKNNYNISFSQARPYNTGNSPYIYSPVVGNTYTATLQSPVNSSTTLFTISDASTSPVFVGQRLIADNEIMRVMNVSGTSVTVERGSESTVAVSHNSGTINVGYRINAPLHNGNVFSATNYLVELVSSSPHKLKTGTMPVYLGSWPIFTYTDGGSGYLNDISIGAQPAVWVTGPSSFVIAYGTSLSNYATLNTTIDCSGHGSAYWSVPYNFFLGSQLLPYAAAAKAINKLPGTDFHVNFGKATTDASIDQIARDIRDNLDAGRNIWLELSNEVWNFPIQKSYFSILSNLFNYGYSFGYLIRRTCEIKQRFVNIFNENNINRGSEIKAILNVQTVRGTASSALNFAAGRGYVIDAICNAPYIDQGDYNDPQTNTAFSIYDAQQALDLYIHNLYYNFSNTTGFVTLIQDHTNAINTYNNIVGSGINCRLLSYEGGIQYPWGSFTNHVQKTRDFIYDPNMYIIDQDWYNLLQSVGYYRFTAFHYCGTYFNAGFEWCLWPYYTGPIQQHGRGDGSDGKFDNRQYLAMPGFANTKNQFTSKDMYSVSVRGQALLDWNNLRSSNLSSTINYLILRKRNKLFRNLIRI